MQTLPDFQYLEPETTAEAVKLLRDAGSSCMIIGGGTDMVPSMRQGIFSPEYVLSLQSVSDLHGVEWDDQVGLKIGPLATLRSLETNGDIRKRFPVIAQAAHAVGSPQLREMATVGGNICLDTRCYYYNQSEDWQACDEECLKLGGVVCKASPSGRAKKCFAVFSADLAPVLVALDARVTLASSRGEQTIPLREFYTGDGANPNVIEPDEIITSIVVPKDKEGVFGVYQKYRVRNAIDYPIAGVALTLRQNNDATASEVCLVVSGVASKPVVVKGTGDLFDGNTLDEALVEKAAQSARKAALPLANTAGERAHRKQMIYQFTKRAFALAAEQAAQQADQAG